MAVLVDFDPGRGFVPELSPIGARATALLHGNPVQRVKEINEKSSANEKSLDAIKVRGGYAEAATLCAAAPSCGSFAFESAQRQPAYELTVFFREWNDRAVPPVCVEKLEPRAPKGFGGTIMRSTKVPLPSPPPPNTRPRALPLPECGIPAAVAAVCGGCRRHLTTRRQDLATALLLLLVAAMLWHGAPQKSAALPRQDRWLLFALALLWTDIASGLLHVVLDNPNLNSVRGSAHLVFWAGRGSRPAYFMPAPYVWSHGGQPYGRTLRYV
jgi:hypothetical protein